jgi:tripartite-type tricarboxylate transporter receptor subunit TctC
MAQEFPERPVNLVAPFNAGGGTDVAARLRAHLQKRWEAMFSSLTWRSGSGTVAAAASAGQKADGYYQLGYWSVTVATISRK